jgi:hypothetical protein
LSNNYIRSTAAYLSPVVLAVNSTHFQVGFYYADTHVNRLLGVLGTVATFDTNPTSLANATDGDFSTSTGEGNKTVASATTLGTITWDLGGTYDVELRAKIGVWSNTSSVAAQWFYSEDDSNFYYVSTTNINTKTGTTEYVMYSQLEWCHAQKVRLIFASGAAQNGSAKVYEVEAIDTGNSVFAVAGSGATVYWFISKNP